MRPGLRQGNGLTACITLDLEPDFGGRVPGSYTAWSVPKVDGLLRLLERHRAPVTLFVVGEALEIQSAVIERFRRYGAQFHLHSHSHDLGNPDSEEEIRRGREAFEGFFGVHPEGYRAPEGRISPAGWRRLEAEGFRFDASVFPSLWPRPRYLWWPRSPFYPAGDGLLEIPFSTLSFLRVPLSLSWMKLLGWPAYRFLLESERLPELLVFGSHLHDLWETPSWRRLSPPWSWVYGRNQTRGIQLMDTLLTLVARRGFAFSTLGAVAREYTPLREPRAAGGQPW